VESLLAQTHADLRVVVVNDGDPEPPWNSLKDIHDSRLVCLSFEFTYGPYFATEVVLNAMTDRYLLIQDADDWSAPERISMLLAKLESEHADFAFSAESHSSEAEGSDRTLRHLEWCTAPNTTVLNCLRYRFPHHGLWRAATLRNIGATTEASGSVTIDFLPT
jgi:glycosyltransferase involved in cell wall biosynthesis